MKRFLRVLCCALTAVVACAMCLGLVACEDIRTLEVKVSVYDADSSKQLDKTVTVDLYRHLAPETVDKILSYVKEGYYDDTLFYKNSFYTNIMLGDFKIKDNALEIVSADYVEPINGEFNANGTALKGEFGNEKGSIGLWRQWQANGSYSTNNDAAFNSGRATWFIPIETKAEYDGYFCVFGKIDLTDAASDNSTVFTALNAIMNNTAYNTSYAVYYTGDTTVNEDGSINYDGLTYHRILTTDYREDYDTETKMIDGEEVFEAEGEEYTSYNKHDISVPVLFNSGVATVYAKIVSVTVK